MKNKTIRIGFDLDGVLLYNPARIARPIISFIKKNFLGRDDRKFYLPKNRIEKGVWNLLHKSSLWKGPGIETLMKLIDEEKIKAYIVSARYEFLKGDFNNWVEKIDRKKKFSGYYFNDQNEQPYLFKQKMINRLKLDYFVEDNWDIVNYLSKLNKKCKIFWIFNIFDRHIDYQYKYSSLQDVTKTLKKLL